MKTIQELKNFMSENVETVMNANEMYYYKGKIVRAEDYEDAIKKIAASGEVVEYIRKVNEETLIISDYPKLKIFACGLEFEEEGKTFYFSILAKEKSEAVSLCQWIQKETGALVKCVSEDGEYQLI